MDITYQYNKKRGNFGRQPLFCEQGPALCDTIVPNVAERRNYILRNPVHEATQHTRPTSEHTVNTIRAEMATSGCNHAEGGWPRDVNVTDPEATQRYRRKVEKDDPYIHCVMSVAPGMEHYVLQNNAVNMYNSYYAEMEAVAAPERSGVRTVNVYRDPAPPRPVLAARWLDAARVLTATADLQPDRRPRGSTRSHLWDVNEALEPTLALWARDDALLDLAVSTRIPNCVGGALLSGRVGIWDTRVGGEPTVASAPHVSHREMARRLLFINSKSGREFFSSGPDGVCKWWDLRNMDECIDELIIDTVKSPTDAQSMATANGVSALEYEPTMPSRFMVGTENGLIIAGNRKGKTAYEKLPAKYAAHLGPVWSLERNPGFLKIFLSVGDWTTRVWSEDCRESAVIWSPPQRQRQTSAAWSPTRLSLMLVTQSNGVLCVWDLLRRQHRPALTAQLCAEPLRCVSMHEGGSLAACGSQRGNMYLVELSYNLSQSDKNDKSMLTAMFEREGKRERILEARLRELRLKMRQDDGSPAVSATGLLEQDLNSVTAQYMQTVRRELAAM